MDLPTKDFLSPTDFFIRMHFHWLYCYPQGIDYEIFDQSIQKNFLQGFINVFKFLYVSISSLYLEEAFEALHFQHRRQIRFVIGSLVAALLGVILNVYQARLKEDKIAEKQHGTLPKEQQETLFKFGWIHHLGLAFCAILSTLVFETELSTPTWIISIINLSGMFLHLFIDE